ncbi:MAG: proline--tRNA ligase [Firmicutes bacterium]|nr:proline--tRNA ligase [Bacillota bacterium]
MLMSQVFVPTLREVPKEAEIPSHQLMLRAGLIRKNAGGIYTYLPLGLKVIQKIEAIIREELNAKGSQELLMPIIQPAELWEQTGRWEIYGDEMFRLTDRHGRRFCLGPTHEELITALVGAEVSSYRQLPLRLYQIQNKYRDEIRPRFGLMRGREFIMKDLYSFDRDEAGLEESYQAMYEAYTRIFQRCGLETRPVEADPGAIGGNSTHEFMVIAETGEAAIVYCTECDYAANVEKAELLPPEEEVLPTEALPEQVFTPDTKTIEEVANFLGLPESATIKSLLYEVEGEPVMVLVRGDHILNEFKLAAYLGTSTFRLADDDFITENGFITGYVGPVSPPKKVRVIADYALKSGGSYVVGANKEDTHLKNVVPGRDFEVEAYLDLRQAQPGDLCPRCRGELKGARGIEVGQIFKLGTKYSEALNATYVDEEGNSNYIYMGCYGIGVGRTMAAAIEQNHDENGIIWPLPIAPAQVIIVPVAYHDEQQKEIADRLYHSLMAAGFEVILDDRDERPGVKFKDADLIGIPYRVTVGPKGIKNGVLELYERKTGEIRELPIEGADRAIESLLRSV